MSWHSIRSLVGRVWLELIDLINIFLHVGRAYLGLFINGFSGSDWINKHSLEDSE